MPRRLFGAVVVMLATAGAAWAQTAANVAVVINEQSAASQRIGEHYIRERGIPSPNVIRIRVAESEQIERGDYLAAIERPIAAALARGRLQDQILYIVLTKGIPLRVAGTTGLQGAVSSVDSELTLLYRRMTGAPTPVAGRIDNPYFLAAKPLREARPFTHRDYDIYLVTRLDAYTVDEAMALVSKAQSAVRTGRFVLDQRGVFTQRTGEDWLETAADRLKQAGRGDDVVLETTPVGARAVKPVLGYYSWGSNDPLNRVRDYEMGFVPGSLAGMFVSTDARTFKEPPATWEPLSDWNDRASFHEGSPQSLAGDLIRQGVTGVAGHVAEPFLQSTIRPEVLFPAYIAGFNLAESFYLGMPHLSWQTVVVGDPLCGPFQHPPVAATDVDVALDEDLQAPVFFARRRLARVKAAPGMAGLPERTLALLVRAESLVAADDAAGARAALEQATELSPRFLGAQVQLAMLYEQAELWPQASERYMRVLTLQPDNALALNNLAYGIAVRNGAPKEALPFARRALQAAPTDANVLDTVAWVEYLLNDHQAAAKHIAEAIRRSPRDATVRLHAALINDAAGARAVAQTQLTEALRLDPSLASREDVRKLQDKLKAQQKQPPAGPTKPAAPKPAAPKPAPSKPVPAAKPPAPVSAPQPKG